MRDFTESRARTHTQTSEWQCPMPEASERQVAGNQAAQAGRDASLELDAFAGRASQDEREQLLFSERARLQRLMDPELFQGVPLALIDEEVVRTTRRIESLQNGGQR